MFGSESEADGYIYINAAVPVICKICKKMQKFKQHECDIADTVLNICRDYDAVNTYGDFGEIEKLTAKQVLSY